jgi:hypothetical protein
VGVIRASIPLAAILVGLAAFATRPPSDRALRASAAESRRLPASEEEAPALVPSEPRASVEDAPLRPRPVAAPSPARLEPHAVQRPRIVRLLERELALSPDQRSRVEEVLRVREHDIDDHHRQIRAVGVISGQAYHRHMQDLRARSYAQIGQVLDTEQHRTFLALVAAGALNDVIGFPMYDGLVELD